MLSKNKIVTTVIAVASAIGVITVMGMCYHSYTAPSTINRINIVSHRGERLLYIGDNESAKLRGGARTTKIRDIRADASIDENNVCTVKVVDNGVASTMSKDEFIKKYRNMLDPLDLTGLNLT